MFCVPFRFSVTVVFADSRSPESVYEPSGFEVTARIPFSLSLLLSPHRR